MNQVSASTENPVPSSLNLLSYEDLGKMVADHLHDIPGVQNAFEKKNWLLLHSLIRTRRLSLHNALPELVSIGIEGILNRADTQTETTLSNLYEKANLIRLCQYIELELDCWLMSKVDRSGYTEPAFCPAAN